MISLTTPQQDIIDSAHKIPSWLFKIYDSNDVIYYYSTKAHEIVVGAIFWDSGIEWQAGIHWSGGEGNAYTFAIIDFYGIDLQRARSESGVQAPNELTFSVLNPANALTPSDFNGGKVYLALRISDGTNEEVINRWRFAIKRAEPGYQQFKLTCEDFLSDFLKDDYPNTQLVQDLWYSDDIPATSPDKVCVPKAFGTAYIPLRSVYIPAGISYNNTTIAAVVTNQFTDSANGFLTNGIEKGRSITVTGFTNPANNGTFVVNAVTANTITLAGGSGLVNEAAGDSVTITEGSRFYILGSDTPTYTVSEVRSPRGYGAKITYGSGSYTFSQSTKNDGDNDYKALYAAISDDGDGNMIQGLWRDGSGFYDMPTKFSRSDTSGLAGPAADIKYVLRDFGINDGDIAGGTFDVAEATYTSWGLAWNGGLWVKESREKLIAKLMIMCHSTLVVGEQIELKVLSKTSQKTITKAELIKDSAPNMPVVAKKGSFNYRDTYADKLYDSGHIGWQESGESQDAFIKTLVQAKSSNNNIADEILEIPFVQDSQDAQRVGILYYQRKFLKIADISFKAKGTCLALQPDDVITLNHADYGGSYDVLIDSMRINKDLSIDFKCIRFSDDLDDWSDLSPSAITVENDDTTIVL